MIPPFVFDTSALLAHCLGESGAETVDAILERFPGEVRISVMSWLEFHVRLDELHPDPDEREEILACYAELLDDPVPVTKEVAVTACDLRRRAARRIPNADALIAATAKLERATLVHRDPHLEILPQNVVKQIVLPGKQPPAVSTPS